MPIFKEKSLTNELLADSLHFLLQETLDFQKEKRSSRVSKIFSNYESYARYHQKNGKYIK